MDQLTVDQESLDLISDLHVLQNEHQNAGEAGISARLMQGIWSPPDKEKTQTADRKSGGIAATIMEMADDQLYGKAYAQTLRGEDKPQVADAKMPAVFPQAKIVNGENGYIDFGAGNDEVSAARSVKSSRLAA